MKFILPTAAGLLTGILSGWGVGGGTILMVCLTAFAGMSHTAARSVNLLYFLPTSLTALYWHGKNRLIRWRCALPAAAAGVAAAICASLLATGLDRELTRRIFGGFLVLVGLSEFRRQ